MKKISYLRQFRQNIGATQQQIADILTIPRTQVVRYEQEKNEFPIRYLVALCDHYGVSADYILGREKPQP